MYGTIARMRLKPGMEDKLADYLDEEPPEEIPGFVSYQIYQMDSDPRDIMMTVAFADEASYRANAESPEQHQRYLKMMEMLEGEPHWHDGTILYAQMGD